MSGKAGLRVHRIGSTAALTLFLSLFVSAAAWATPDYDGDGAIATDCAPLDPNAAPGKPDQPDLSFQDTNCDGIDGTESKAIFVSAQAPNNNGTGSKLNPYQTLNFAIPIAKAAGKSIYVTGGTFNEMVALADNVSIYGGFRPGFGSRTSSAAEATTIQAQPQAVLADGDTGVVLQLLTLKGIPDGSGNAYGLRAIGGSSVLVSGLTTQPGDAVAGANGSNGDTGANGGVGTDGTGWIPGDGPNPGGAGGSGGGYAGGGGGTSTSNDTGAPGGAGGGGGLGGDAGAGGTNSNGYRGGDGGPGLDNTFVGAPGSNAVFRTTNAGAAWLNSALANAGAGGGSGGGAGGGGGGSGDPNVSCGTYAGGSGAGGGAGGGGGGGGQRGANGRGSFGVYVHGSSVVVDHSLLRSGKGGKGGNGGAGGGGGLGGAGGVGGPADFPTCTMGSGGNGGNGGNGAGGGGGGGGAGGPSIALFAAATGSFVSRSTQTIASAAGEGGLKGGTTSRAPSGLATGTSGIVNTTSDFDGDAVKDVNDACPEIRSPGGNGCPARAATLPDADGDGIPNGADACPTTPRGVDANEDGCPDITSGGGGGAGAGGGGGGGGGGTTLPPAPTVVPSTVSNHWLAFRRFTKVDILAVNDIPAAARVRVQCKTKKKKQQKRGCPYTSRSVTTTFPRSRLSVLKPFKKKKMPVGTRLTITITATGYIGKQFRFTVRRGKAPKRPTKFCIPPGGKPAPCA
jgi:hypothetical protein